MKISFQAYTGCPERKYLL